MNVAVVFNSYLHAGGGFQQELSTALILRDKSTEAISFKFFTFHRPNIAILARFGIAAEYISFSVLDKALAALSVGPVFFRLLKMMGLQQGKYEKEFGRQKVDLVFFLSPCPMAMGLTRYNYVQTVWDLCHRDCVEFPEVNFDREFETREFFYRNTLPKAVAVICDSSLGRKNIIRRYGVDPVRVHVAHFLPSEVVCGGGRVPAVDVKAKYGVSGDYIFYPAQFWAHKNHVYILQALQLLLKEYGGVMHAVFSGGDKGNRQYLESVAEDLGLTDYVHFIGFVEESELADLYRQAFALVMPTYFGPTNIPPLEAFALGCPVFYPNLPGLRDQVGEAAYLMDLNDPSDLTRQLMNARLDESDRQEKCNRGKQLLENWGREQYWLVIEGILRRFQEKRKCWR